jgi:uncharacterized membrane protein YidH (DUF202 family)
MPAAGPPDARPPDARPPDDRPPDDRPPDPGLAQERTALAWTRTAISFAAVGGVVLKREVLPGLILLAVAPAIWLLGRLAYRRQDRLILLTAAVVAVAIVAVVVSFT